MTTSARVRGISAVATIGALGAVWLLNFWVPAGGSLFAWVVSAVAWVARIAGTVLFLGSALIFINTLFVRNDDLWNTWLFRYMRALCGWLKISFCPAAWLTGLVAALWIFTALVWGLEVLWTGLFFFSPVYWGAVYVSVAPYYNVVVPALLCFMLLALVGIPSTSEELLKKFSSAALVLYLVTVLSTWSVALFFEPLRTIGADRYGTYIGWGILFTAVICLFCAVVYVLWLYCLRVLRFIARGSSWFSEHTLLGAILGQEDAPWCPVITVKEESASDNGEAPADTWHRSRAWPEQPPGPTPTAPPPPSRSLPPDLTERRG